MVLDAFALFGGDLVRYNRKAFVHLHGVGIDDFAIKSSSDIDCKLEYNNIYDQFGHFEDNFAALTSDFPVPVEPKMTTRGAFVWRTVCAIVAVQRVSFGMRGIILMCLPSSQGADIIMRFLYCVSKSPDQDPESGIVQYAIR